MENARVVNHRVYGIATWTRQGRTRLGREHVGIRIESMQRVFNGVKQRFLLEVSKTFTEQLSLSERVVILVGCALYDRLRGVGW